MNKVVYGSFVLAAGGLESPSGFSLNGQQVNDVFEFARAASVTLVPRGNRATTIGFSVDRNFNTERAASRFKHAHFADLAEQAALNLYLGTDASGEWVRYDDAVLDAIALNQRGVCVTVSYQFRAAAPSFEASAPTTIDPDDNMKATDTPITSGADSVAVTFATPFSTTPKITGCFVSVPDGGAALVATVQKSSVSPTGFTAYLSAPAPSSGYYLTWSALP